MASSTPKGSLLTSWRISSLSRRDGEFAWPPEVRTTELNARMRAMGIPPVPMRIAGRVMRGYERDSIPGTGERNADSVTDDHDEDEAALSPAETIVTAENEDAAPASEYDGGTKPLPVSHDDLDDMARRANGRKPTKTSREKE